MQSYGSATVMSEMRTNDDPSAFLIGIATVGGVLCTWLAPHGTDWTLLLDFVVGVPVFGLTLLVGGFMLSVFFGCVTAHRPARFR